MTTPGGPPPIKAVPLRRPGRWISAVVLLVLFALFCYGAASNDAYQWSIYTKYLFDQRISRAAVVTLELTVIAMVAAILLGIVIAIMRRSDNFVLRSLAWLYLWFFRGTPVYVQLVFWGLITVIYKQWSFGVPFTDQLFSWDSTFATLDLATYGQRTWAPFVCSYVSPIVRYGMQ